MTSSSSLSISTDPTVQGADQVQTLVACTQALAQLDGQLGAERGRTEAALVQLVEELRRNQETLANQLLQQQQRIAQLESQQRVSENLRVQEQQQKLREMQAQQVEKTKKTREKTLQDIQASCGKSLSAARSELRRAKSVIEYLTMPTARVSTCAGTPYPATHFMHRFFLGTTVSDNRTLYLYCVEGRGHLPYFQKVRDDNKAIIERYENA